MKLHLLYVKDIIHNVPGCVLFSVQLLYHAATDVEMYTHTETQTHTKRHFSKNLEGFFQTYVLPLSGYSG